MKKYTVNVHYDYYTTVEVEAENESEALIYAKGQADEVPTADMEYCDFIDSCVTDVEEIE